MKKQIVIGCDNAAIDLKNELIKVLSQEGIPFEDIGVQSKDDQTYYPAVAEKVALKIIESDYTKEGILLCGTGIGMSMTANKFPGIFAGVCHDTYSAERLRLSNDGNVICMGARVIGSELAKKILKEWLSLTYIPNGPSQPKVNSMRSIDNYYRNNK